MPPAPPLPTAAAGCARLEQFAGTDQMQDGTGVGNTTRAGWWIPTEADIPQQGTAASAQMPAVLPRPASNAQLALQQHANLSATASMASLIIMP